MVIQMKLIPFVCTIFLILGCGTSFSAMKANESTSRVVGGPCEYKKYKGKARIISICKKEMPENYIDLSYDTYEVKFTFHPEEEIEKAWAKKVEEREYTLLLTNGWHPGPQFLKKYGVEEGKHFDCFLNVITRGTCTPVIFDFPAINRSDYFESKR